jgi:LacI family transcriptional regulator
VLRGFAQVAHEQGWTILHYHPDLNLHWLSAGFRPDAAVLGPEYSGLPWPAALRRCVSVAVNIDRTAEGIASVCLDEGRIAELAFEHLFERGFRNLTTFRFEDTAFAKLREARFHAAAQAAGARLQPAWWAHAPMPHLEDGASMMQWLARIERPCGIFACSDTWARVVARYAQAAQLRVPEELALIGADNDVLECEIMVPPLSSIAVPWCSVGERVARLVQAGLSGTPVAGTADIVQPSGVVARRSSDSLAIEDPLVSRAVAWIHEQAEQPVTVPMVARAVGATRQQLERRFRRALGRTVMQEVRRAHVEIARDLLSSTSLPLSEIAKKSGFTNATLLSVTFRREVGEPPGAYRRRVGQWVDSDED